MKNQFELQLPDLLYFVKASCHENLHDTLHELRDMTVEISKKQHGNPEFPKDLPPFLIKFIQDLQRHLAHEENTLFPSIAAGKTSTRTDSIPDLVDDHEQMMANLISIRGMTHNYHLPINLDVDFLNFYKKLREMDRIILNHIQIEDQILFPMLLKIS